MNIADSIRTINPVMYGLMSYSTKTVSIEFSDELSEDFRRRITMALKNLGISFGSYGNAKHVRLMADSEQDKRYLLKYDAEKKIRIADVPGSDVAESIAWCIYLLAANEGERLSQAGGDYIWVQAFSAQQQAVAADLMGSIQYHNRTDVNLKTCNDLIEQFDKKLADIIKSQPVFSEQPILVENYEELGNMEGSISAAALANVLYKNNQFSAELRQFTERVFTGNLFRTSKKEAITNLCQRCCEMPLESLYYFFKKMNDYTDNIMIPSDELIRQQLYHEKGYVVRKKWLFKTNGITASELKGVFQNTDKAYYIKTAAMIKQRFLRDVLKETQQQLDQIIPSARENMQLAFNELRDFCFMGKKDFPGGAQTPLAWNLFRNIPDKSLQSVDIAWDDVTFGKLQREMISRNIVTQVWLCSERLHNLSVMHNAPEVLKEYPIQIQNERYVWAVMLGNERR